MLWKSCITSCWIMAPVDVSCAMLPPEPIGSLLGTNGVTPHISKNVEDWKTYGRKVAGAVAACIQKTTHTLVLKSTSWSFSFHHGLASLSTQSCCPLSSKAVLSPNTSEHGVWSLSLKTVFQETWAESFCVYCFLRRSILLACPLVTRNAHNCISASFPTTVPY